ncbi:MAG TPA: S1 RNA-binding domain-containing protein [Planctomycetes bacterium]|nr:S1 RNA-binding domain-containing protein [Planctomycetota bacterium]
MSNSRELLKKYSPSNDEVDRLLNDALEEGVSVEDSTYDESVGNFQRDTILKGKVISIIGDDVIVDIGYKSEGVVDIHEFGDTPPQVNDEIEVYLEELEDQMGMMILSKKKADRIRGWNRVVSEHKEGDVIKGMVMRKIKGGLLVDIGIPVFLPASQVSIRRTADVSAYIGKEIEARIIKIDESRMNIVISRRKLLEEGRDQLKQELLSDLAEGQLRHGVVKNIADFGAFVDLGGIDGLLHITDMSWGRINHPSEILKIDDEVEVKILKFDRDNERIALGLKQKTESPWRKIEERFRPGDRVRGEVVNVMSYGAFIKLEEGVEGLVHISEMSWTRRVNHPSELVNIGDIVDVIVLNVNASKQEISLGMKQVEENPWTTVEDKYPVGTIIRGRVRNLTNYGAFVEIEEGIDGLLHISDMSWTRKISHPSEMVKKGDEIETIVLSVDQDKKRVALGIKQLSEDPWIADIPTRYRVGEELEGEVTKITNFGVFVNIGNDLEGLMHISELSDSKVENPEEIVHVGDKVLVRIIKVNTEERKIGLSLMDVVERAETPPPAVERPEETEETKESDKAPETPAIEAESAPEAVEVAATESSEAEATVPPTAEETDAPQAEASPEDTAEAAEDPETKDSEG